MAFKMNKFSGFKSTEETVEKVGKKVGSKVASKQIKKQLVKQGLKTAARSVPVVGAAVTAYDAAKAIQKEEVGQKAVGNMKKKGSSRSQFLGKV